MTPRLISFVVASLLLFAACGTGETTPNTDVSQATATTGASESTAAPDAPAGTEAPATSEAPTTDGTEAAAVEPSGVEGPDAPDFSLALGDGSTYQLAADDKPVYLVFWAEW